MYLKLLKYFHIDLQAVLAINLMMNHFVKQLYDFFFMHKKVQASAQHICSTMSAPITVYFLLSNGWKQFIKIA